MVPRRHEWDLNILRSRLLSHDVHEVRKIYLFDRISEDMIAWHYERTGKFSVRSAYKLALQIENEVNWQEGSSRVPDGHRAMYKEVWNTVGVFGWRLAQEGLATQENRKL
jgi:hypothetical protein